MIETALGRSHAMTAPHRTVSAIGSAIMEEGGTAIEAMIAAAAAIAVVYPHMNGIGGDGFWLIRRPGEKPVGISACGGAAALATPEWYTKRGSRDMIPARGCGAALTVPGTLDGWRLALEMVPQNRRRSLMQLLAPAIKLAREGFAVSRNQAEVTAQKRDELRDIPGFAPIYLHDGQAPAPGARMVQSALADTLEQIARHGTDVFYRGDVAETMARFLDAQGSPLRASDFAGYRAERVVPLEIGTRFGRLYNIGAPTQGMSSLAILGLFDRLDVGEGESFAHVHGLIEATKQAFLLRNAELGDPAQMREPAQALLADARLEAMARSVDMEHALPWPHVAKPGDTIWMGAADADGTMVSFIQSVFWEFGSGLTCPDTGVLFQNRGSGFSLSAGPNQLGPGRRPFHTLNPAMAELEDGRVMAYGTMGGEGQPQTQAAIFTRHVAFGVPLQQAVTRPRWVLGKTWGADSSNLKVEADLNPELVAALEAAGHVVEVLPAANSRMGHSGAIVRHPDGLLEAASDPRSDGVALAV